MRRLLIAMSAFALLLASSVGADEEKKGDKATKKPAEVFKEMMKDGVEKFRAATDPEEKQKVLKTLAEKMTTFASQNSKDAMAPQALLTVIVGMPLQDKELKSKALAILKKDHAANPAIARFVPQLAQSDNPDVIGFLDEVMKHSKDKKVRAEIVKAKMGACESGITSGDAKKAEESRKQLAEYRKLIESEYKGQIKDLFIGAKMPELKSKGLDDKDVKLSDLKGKVVVLDVWATWCGPCRAMIPHERELVERLKDKPFALVSVSGDEKKETLTKFLEDNKMPWTHWWDGGDRSVLSALDVTFFPTIYVLDANGVIRYKNVRGPQMDKAVDTLLSEMKSGKGGKSE